MRVNFARLNHILIPASSAERARFRTGWLGAVFRPLFRVYLAFTDEGRLLSLLWFVALGAGLNVDSSQIYLVFSAITGLLLASALARPAYRMRDVTARIEPPHRMTAGDEVALSIVVKNRGAEPVRALRVERPLPPWDGAWRGRAPSIDVVRPGEESRAVVSARFSHRGEHHLDPFHVARLVPFSLAQGPAVSTDDARFLVVPRVARVEAIDLPRAARYQPGGVATASVVGEASEFVGLRAYRPGDRVRDIHARSWARVGEPVIREYQQEYFTRIGVILDADVEAGERRLEAGISLAAGVTDRLAGGEALVDLLVVGDAVHELTMGRHVGTVEQALDLLAVVEPGQALTPARLDELLAPHRNRLSALVLIVLSWDDARRDLVDGLRRAGSPVRILRVVDEKDAASADPEVTDVARDAIHHRESLWL